MKKISTKLRIPSTLPQASQEQMLQGDGYFVKSYAELSQHIAELACANPDLILFYRGQSIDYKVGKIQRTSLLPTLYRNVTALDEKYRIKKLKIAGEILSNKLRIKHVQNARVVERKKLIQWSILQHYEVTETPLIDVTQSLRVACSFALLNQREEFVYIYVLGLPYCTNRISVNSEEYLTNIRLISIIPPIALRPYYQEGFLVGEDTYEDDMFAHKEEKDLANRLIYKFKISRKALEEADEKWLDKILLMPDNDQMKIICDEVKKELDATSTNDDMESNELIGSFITEWQRIEHLIISYMDVRDASGKYNLLAAIRKLDNVQIRERINQLRYKRNVAVHNSFKEANISQKDIIEAQELYNVLSNILLKQ